MIFFWVSTTPMGYHPFGFSDCSWGQNKRQSQEKLSFTLIFIEFRRKWRICGKITSRKLPSYGYISSTWLFWLILWNQSYYREVARWENSIKNIQDLSWFWADYEQILRAFFSCFQGQFFFFNIVKLHKMKVRKL